MFPSLILAAALSACGGDTNFTVDNNNQTDVGTGEMTVIPVDGVEWVDVVPGFPCSQYVRIDSVGNDDLNIDRIDITESGGGVFSLSETLDGITLSPGSTKEFTVQADMSALGEATGELRIKSNDITTMDFRLPLHAVSVDSWDTGDTAGQPGC